jgi:hypothetical protein
MAKKTIEIKDPVKERVSTAIKTLSAFLNGV